jgi:hypothetical protein
LEYQDKTELLDSIELPYSDEPTLPGLGAE